ncbi:uncharacterized protein LOC133201847 [Saccostrea echinata]|uniref:uncharacterized protein LOC133201847 n=1 Tax=Saccostrea echinata TaxID=191078 RepID=UPI002A80333F|nr:uncharacterized protein LOC133201847 [Saccostrea echinata]
MLRSEIVDKYQLAKNSELLNVISDHGCVSKFPLDSEITAENRTQEIYEFLVKIYALLDMTSIEFEDALNVAPPSFSIPFKYVNGEIKKLQKQIMKVICNTDLLLRSVGVVRRDFPIYSKREESSIFNSRLTFQMNLYANMNRIRDMLEQVKVEAKLTLPSLIF